MRITISLFLSALIGVAAWAPAAASQADLLPTEVLHRINEALAQGDRSKQGEIVRPFIAAAKKSGLSAEDDMALGEIYFLALNPRDSDAIFVKYLGRTDRLGRMAWIRHQQVQFRAFDKHDETEQAIDAFRKQFAIDPDDLTYSSVMAWNQADRYAAAKNYAKAVELILSDIKPLPLNLPFRAFRLLATHFNSFVEVGRGREARTILQSHRDALEARIAAAAMPALLPASALRTQSRRHRPGVLHADWDTGNADDDPAFDRERFNTQLAIDRIKELDGLLAKMQ